MPGKTLIPGYRQVETFGPDEDYEQRDGQVEEEIAYVTLDLGLVEPTLVPSSSSYRLIVSRADFRLNSALSELSRTSLRRAWTRRRHSCSCPAPYSRASTSRCSAQNSCSRKRKVGCAPVSGRSRHV